METNKLFEAVLFHEGDPDRMPEWCVVRWDPDSKYGTSVFGTTVWKSYGASGKYEAMKHADELNALYENR